MKEVTIIVPDGVVSRIEVDGPRAVHVCHLFPHRADHGVLPAVWRFARRLGLVLDHEKKSGSWFSWDGRTLSTQGLASYQLLHEIAHWRVASRRDLSEFGLGTNPLFRGARLCDRVLSPEECRAEEYAAFHLGAVYAMQFRCQTVRMPLGRVNKTLWWLCRWRLLNPYQADIYKWLIRRVRIEEARWYAKLIDNEVLERNLRWIIREVAPRFGVPL